MTGTGELSHIYIYLNIQFTVGGSIFVMSIGILGSASK